MAGALKIERPDAMSAPQPGVAVEHVFKSFGVEGVRVEALRDVSLNVAPGEFVTLLGPSGCGKSTLLRLLAGLDTPDRGRLSVDGREVQKPSIARGLVFQDHRLLPWLSVSENIRLSLHTVADSAAEKARRVSELLDLVGLASFADAKPHQLSGGMSQRAAIARALAPRPRLLLLDEPLGALDSFTRSRLQSELLALWEHEKITVVMVTHDVEEAVFLSNRVAVMEPRPGRIKEIVTIDQPHPRGRTDGAFIAQRQRILGFLEDVT
jgi:ABC-type nitrate/sulfonate/bicarbonate transport system ATPase subunit